MTRSFVVIAMVWLAAGCVEPSQCLGSSPSGACLRIRQIWPCEDCGYKCTVEEKSSKFMYEIAGHNPVVDVTRGTCTRGGGDGGAAMTVAEPFGDHSAIFAVTNEPREMNAEKMAVKMPAVVLKNVRIQYQLNECPAGDNCPQTIDEVTLAPGQTVSFEAGLTECFVLPLFPLRRKLSYARDYTANFGPSYTAKYILDAVDPRFPDHRFTMEGYTPITLANVDNCN